jgi:hypothetical protein
MNKQDHGKLVSFLLKYQLLEEGSYIEEIKRMIRKNRQP